MFSGWGITTDRHYYITFSFGRSTAGWPYSIHRAANLPLAFFFLAHVLLNIKIALSRGHSSLEWPVNGMLIFIGALVLALVIYLNISAWGDR
jgi:succinate dehydrogenase/fumarate reductase cytochrome b subunit